MIRPVLVTGGAGFIGCNLVERLARDGEDVVILDALSRPGVERNLAWLRQRHGPRVQFLHGDIRDAACVQRAVDGVKAVFHLAAQVAVTTSLASPAEDFGINLQGTFLLIEALRRRGSTVPLIFASTNKVYGNLADVALDCAGDAYLPQDATLRTSGIGEARALEFHTPYGCSKGAADQYVLDAWRSFGIPGVVLRMSCVYGPHQMGTEDQGWVAHFMIRALRGEPISIYGDGRQVRDILFVEDAVAAYVAAWRRIEAVRGLAFNLGGGPANAISLRQLLATIGEITGQPATVSFHPWRNGDQRYFVADTRRAQQALGLAAPMAWRAGVRRLAIWLQQEALEPVEASP